MDVIKEFRNVFLEKYLEKNRLGRKSKLTATAPAASMSSINGGSSSVLSSRTLRKNVLRRRLSSVDKDLSNETIKKVSFRIDLIN